MNHDAHTLREFDAALTSLNTHLLQMAYKAQNALDLAVSGLLQQDEDSANQAIADDEELDELEMAMTGKAASPGVFQSCSVRLEVGAGFHPPVRHL